MVLPWQHEYVYGCNIIYETHKSNVERIYTPKYHVIYFLYFVYGTWMCASADLGHFEEEYPAWVVFNHLLTPVLCIIARKLHLRSWYIFRTKILKVSPFIIDLNKCGWNLAWVHYGFLDLVGPLIFRLDFQPNWSMPLVFTTNTIATISYLRISMDLKK